MTDHPILFKGDMVNAIRNCKPGVWPAEPIDPSKPFKWQTRRVINPRPLSEWSMPPARFYEGYFNRFGCSQDSESIRCPYGVAGDRLWVREAFAVQPELWASGHDPQPVHYLCDQPKAQIEDYIGKPSIHMPRWSSRETLEVKAVRVERVQDIAEQDARAEGVDPRKFDGRGYGVDGYFLRDVFHDLWDSINLKRGFGWDINPWIWVVEFVRLPAELEAED